MHHYSASSSLIEDIIVYSRLYGSSTDLYAFLIRLHILHLRLVCIAVSLLILSLGKCSFSFFFDLDKTDGDNSSDSRPVMLYDLKMFMVNESLYEIDIVNDEVVSNRLLMVVFNSSPFSLLAGHHSDNNQRCK